MTEKMGAESEVEYHSILDGFEIPDDWIEMSPLNLAVWKALSGFSTTAQSDLAKLLQSMEPIHPWVRSRLARAADRTEGIRLELKVTKAKRDISLGFETREAWIEIGRFARAKIDEGQTRKAALKTAKKKFNASVEKCDKALIYFDKFTRWREAKIELEPKLDEMNERSWLAAFVATEMRQEASEAQS